MKKFIFVIGLLFTLSSCGKPAEPYNNSLEVYVSKLPDGRNVTCIGWISGYSAALSCDWNNAK